MTPLHKKQWCKSRKGESQAVSLSIEEAQSFLKYLENLNDPVYYHIALWQLTSHRQRIGEVLALEWNDVDWQKGIAWITGTMQWVDENGKSLRDTKQYHTKERREQIPVNFGSTNLHLRDSLLFLENQGHSSRWVFADRMGSVPSLNHINKVYKRSGFFKEKGLATHKCRKTALTLATINFGVDLAKRLGGHSTDSAHVRYIDRQMKEMANPVPEKLAEVLGVNSRHLEQGERSRQFDRGSSATPQNDGVASKVESRHKKTPLQRG